MRAVRSRSGRVWLVLRYVLLVVLSVLFLLPFYVIVRNAFASDRLIAAARWRWLPDKMNLDNISQLFTNSDVDLGGALVNSAITAVAQTVLTVIVALMAGYALTRFHGRLARILTGMTIFTLMVPAAVTFIPTFVITSSLGWIDTYRGLVVPTMFSAFATYMFRQSFLNFPSDLEEAAYIDGASMWSAFWRIVVPNSLGIVGAVGTITFIGAWNAFLWPMLIARDNTRTVQLTLSQFMTSQNVNYPQLFAGALVAIIPVLLVFLFLQRFLVQGTETSGLK